MILTMTVLLTGFAPFGGMKKNPSGEIARLFNGKEINGERIIGKELPVSYRRVREVLEKLIDEVNPSLYLGIGLAPRSTCIRIEVIALNIVYSERPDEDGVRQTDISYIYEDGDLAYITTIPAKRIVNELRRSGIPASLSFSAGTYLCNYAFYIAAHLLKRKGNGRYGFIHIPQASEYVVSEVNTPSLPFNVLVKAIEKVLYVILGS
ncbi:MAG: pyroglutamyl-peptidase I [Thermoprotei archaeon]|nr:MAG: pyroglutamyl-peptidase I [Thermoprotei archaeon]